MSTVLFPLLNNCMTSSKTLNKADGVGGKAYFLNMADLSGLKEDNGIDDILEVKSISETGAHAGDKGESIFGIETC